MRRGAYYNPPAPGRVQRVWLRVPFWLRFCLTWGSAPLWYPVFLVVLLACAPFALVRDAYSEERERDQRYRQHFGLINTEDTE